HEVGDEVLKMLSNTLINNSRPFDVFGRWGGEEFLGVIRNVDQTELSKVAERIRVLVEKSFIVHEGKRLRATISIGATLFQDEDTMESVIKRADDLLYESKRSGRNRVTVG
ncbi:MAG TPA: sensor domain-containing diguanylate cyclase, partial [Thermovirga lienii]|nr:sensor domain-containing diguanylate cyclase [Thermovirga lienii]